MAASFSAMWHEPEATVTVTADSAAELAAELEKFGRRQIAGTLRDASSKPKEA